MLNMRVDASKPLRRPTHDRMSVQDDPPLRSNVAARINDV